jgi:hypothetical protein
VLGVQRRGLDVLRGRRPLAVLRRGDRRARDAGPRRGTPGRDVLLPHQPRSVRAAQPRRPDQRLHAVHRHRAERAGRHGRLAETDDGDGHNLPLSLASAQNNIRDNDPYLDTDYKGVEFTARKIFSKKWQMVAGFTIGGNTGGPPAPGGFTNSADLNDPNVTLYPKGIIGNDSSWRCACRAATSCPGRSTWPAR